MLLLKQRPHNQSWIKKNNTATTATIPVVVSEKCLSSSKKKSYFLVYLIIWLVSVLRYDIGADYENTVYDIIDILKAIHSGGNVFDYVSESMKEPGLFLFCFLFSWFPSAHIFVIGGYATVFVIFLYKLLNHYQAHKWGVIIYFLSIIIFQAWDWIRQANAMIIMLYAISMFNVERYKKSLIFVFLAIFFHYSVIFVIPFMFLFKKLSISNKKMAIVLFVSLLLAFLGIFKSVYELALSSIPFYGEMYMASDKYASFDEQNYSSIPFVFSSIWFIFLVFFSKKEHHPWPELLFVGAILFMISGSSLLMDRTAWFFTCSQIVLTPLVCRDNKKKIFNVLFFIMIILHFILINRRFFIEGEGRGCVPYQTIMSDEASNLKFRYREN